jgi:hypothetical protein
VQQEVLDMEAQTVFKRFEKLRKARAVISSNGSVFPPTASWLPTVALFATNMLFNRTGWWATNSTNLTPLLLGALAFLILTLGFLLRYIGSLNTVVQMLLEESEKTKDGSK